MLRAGANLVRGEIEIGLVKVADGDHLGVLVGEKAVQNLVAAIAEADEADSDSVVGPADA